MRLAVVTLFGWYIALSLTPAPIVPTGLGISIAHQRGDEVLDAVLTAFQPPAYHNWVHDPLRMATDSRYTPTAYSMRTSYAQGYIDAAADIPGRFWLIGSEPHCCGTEIDPAEAAQFVQRWEREVGGDYACCGVVLWDGMGWREWLQNYLDSGGPKSPYCHAHLFSQVIYPHLVDLREWLAAHDWECEIILSEVANPWGTVADNKRLMSEAAQRIADGEILASYWYSAPDDWHGLWPTTDLMTHDATALTPLGEHWLSLQPGGANDPTVTLEPVETPNMQLWLPHAGRGE